MKKRRKKNRRNETMGNYADAKTLNGWVRKLFYLSIHSSLRIRYDNHSLLFDFFKSYVKRIELAWAKIAMCYLQRAILLYPECCTFLRHFKYLEGLQSRHPEYSGSRDWKFLLKFCLKYWYMWLILVMRSMIHFLESTVVTLFHIIGKSFISRGRWRLVVR